MKRLTGSRIQGRIRAVDPIRGLAMLMAIAQHAYYLVDPLRVGPATDLVLYTVTRIASVAFMSVSGMMIGYFLGVGIEPARVMARFRQRALFLLVVAHPLIKIALIFAYSDSSWVEFERRIFTASTITDTIAVCLLIAPLLLIRLTRRLLAWLVVGMLLGSAVTAFLWQPHSPWLQAAKSMLFGTLGDDPSPVVVDWPLMPWLAIFLCGGLAGSWLAEARTSSIGLIDLVHRLRHAAVVFFMGGTVGVLAWGAWRFTGVSADPRLMLALYPSRTTILLPLYLSVLCGCLAGLIWHLDLRAGTDPVNWALSVFGRTSLFTYVTQYVFVASVPGLLGLRGHLGLAGVAAAMLLATLATWVLAYLYGRARGWIAADDYRQFREYAGASPLRGLDHTPV